MKELDAQSIIATLGPDIVPIDLPELGGRAYLRLLSNADIQDVGKHDDTPADAELPSDDAIVRLIQKVLCDKHGTPIFNENQLDKVRMIRPMTRIRINNEGMRHNGMTKEAQAELEGKSVATASIGSGSA